MPVLAAHSVGLAAATYVANRDAFARLGAVAVLCDAMRRSPESANMQQAAIFALRILLTADAQAIEALRLDAPRLLNEAVRNHPGLADLHENSTRAMESMVSQPQEWIIDQQRQQRLPSRSSGHCGVVPFSPPPPSPPVPYNCSMGLSGPSPHELFPHGSIPWNGVPGEPLATMQVASGLPGMFPNQGSTMTQPNPCERLDFHPFDLSQGVSQSVPGLLQGPTLTPAPVLQPPLLFSLGHESQEPCLGCLAPSSTLQSGVMAPPWQLNGRSLPNAPRW